MKRCPRCDQAAIADALEFDTSDRVTIVRKCMACGAITDTLGVHHRAEVVTCARCWSEVPLRNWSVHAHWHQMRQARLAGA